MKRSDLDRVRELAHVESRAIGLLRHLNENPEVHVSIPGVGQLRPDDVGAAASGIAECLKVALRKTIYTARVEMTALGVDLDAEDDVEPKPEPGPPLDGLLEAAGRSGRDRPKARRTARTRP